MLITVEPNTMFPSPNGSSKSSEIQFCIPSVSVIPLAQHANAMASKVMTPSELGISFCVSLRIKRKTYSEIHMASLRIYQ